MLWMSILDVWGLPRYRLVGVEGLESSGWGVDHLEVLHGTKRGEGFVEDATDVIAIGYVDVLWAGKNIVEAIFLCGLDNLVHEHFDEAFVLHFKPTKVEHI